MIKLNVALQLCFYPLRLKLSAADTKIEGGGRVDVAPVDRCLLEKIKNRFQSHLITEKLF